MYSCLPISQTQELPTEAKFDTTSTCTKAYTILERKAEAEIVEPEDEDQYALDFQAYANPGGGDFLLSIYFWINILGFMVYCRFITLTTFGITGDDEYYEYRDVCIEGAYYELMTATQKADASAENDAAVKENEEMNEKKAGSNTGGDPPSSGGQSP